MWLYLLYVCVFTKRKGAGVCYIVYVFDLYSMQRYTNLSGLFWVVCKLKLWKLKQTCDSSTVWGSSTWNMRWNFGLFSISFCFPTVSVQSMTVIWISVYTLRSVRGILTWSHLNGRRAHYNIFNYIYSWTELYLPDWDCTILYFLSLLYVLNTKCNHSTLLLFMTDSR